MTRWYCKTKCEGWSRDRDGRRGAYVWCNFHLTGAPGVMFPTACGSLSSAVVSLATHNAIIDNLIFLRLQPDLTIVPCGNHACSRHDKQTKVSLVRFSDSFTMDRQCSVCLYCCWMRRHDDIHLHVPSCCLAADLAATTFLEMSS